MKLDVGMQDLVEVDGQLVEKDALRVVEALKRLDPNLEVICLDPNRAHINEAPFVVCEKCPDGQLRRIFEAWKLDGTIIERVQQADMYRNFDVLAHIDKVNEQIKAAQTRRYREEMLEKRELVGAIARNRKSSFSYVDKKTNEVVTIYEDRPATRVAK